MQGQTVGWFGRHSLSAAAAAIVLMCAIGTAEEIKCGTTLGVEISESVSTTGSGSSCEAAVRNAIQALQGNSPASVNLSCDTCSTGDNPPVIKICTPRVSFDPINDLSCGECFPGPTPGQVFVNCSFVQGAVIFVTCKNVCSQ